VVSRPAVAVAALLAGACVTLAGCGGNTGRGSAANQSLTPSSPGTAVSSAGIQAGYSETRSVDPKTDSSCKLVSTAAAADVLGSAVTAVSAGNGFRAGGHRCLFSTHGEPWLSVTICTDVPAATYRGQNSFDLGLTPGISPTWNSSVPGLPSNTRGYPGMAEVNYWQDQTVVDINAVAGALPPQAESGFQARLEALATESSKSV
jgi:hypothetical protein